MTNNSNCGTVRVFRSRSKDGGGLFHCYSSTHLRLYSQCRDDDGVYEEEDDEGHFHSKQMVRWKLAFRTGTVNCIQDEMQSRQRHDQKRPLFSLDIMPI